MLCLKVRLCVQCSSKLFAEPSRGAGMNLLNNQPVAIKFVRTTAPSISVLFTHSAARNLENLKPLSSAMSTGRTAR